MKKTLTLLALVAALMPMMPLRVNGATITTISVKGVEINRNNITLCTGWYDANKGGGSYSDNNLCWAAACSNLVAWWQDQQDYEIVAPTNSQDIWDQYRATWANEGGFADLGLHWWLDGTYEADNGKPITARAGGRSPEEGGYYADSLIWDPGYKTGVREADLKVLEINDFNNIHDLSAVLVNYIKGGYGVELSCITPNINGHSLTLWAVDYDEDSRIITSLYYTDSDDYKTALTRVSVSEIFDERQESHSTLAWTKPGVDGQYTAWKFTVLNSRLSNDYHYFNILDEESGNIIMKQNVDGEGYTLKAETQEVNDIIFDNSRGIQDRLLTVEGEHAAETLYVNGSGSNTIDVTKGGELVVKEITGGQNLTKTGEGALEIKGGKHTGSMDIQAGDVHNLGQLGDVTLANGGSLVNEGTTGKLTVEKGSVAEIVRSAANSKDGAQAFTLCTVEEGGVLTGSGNFGQVVLNGGSTLRVGNGPELQVYEGNLSVYAANLVFSIDDAMSWRDNATEDKHGWGSYTYSTIDMNNKSLNLDNPEFTFVLGENILKSIAGKDLQTMVGQTFSTTKNLDIGLFLNMQNWNGFNPGDYTTKFVLSEELLAQGFTANIITNNLDYYMSGPDMYMRTGLNVTLAKAPVVPEPTTSTLSLLALASLCARRRRK